MVDLMSCYRAALIALVVGQANAQVIETTPKQQEDDPYVIAVPHGVCSTPTDTQPRVCKLSLPVVKSVQLDSRNAQISLAAKDEPDCRNFRPTVPDIRRFMQRAGVVSKSDWLHTLDWSACSISGTARLVDGRLARWTLHPTRIARYQIQGESEIFLYCPTCKGKPYW